MTRMHFFSEQTPNLYLGSECLHRVTKISGNRNRLVAVLCYATVPGRKNSKKVQKMFWGREEEEAP